MTRHRTALGLGAAIMALAGAAVSDGALARKAGAEQQDYLQITFANRQAASSTRSMYIGGGRVIHSPLRAPQPNRYMPTPSSRGWNQGDGNGQGAGTITQNSMRGAQQLGSSFKPYDLSRTGLPGMGGGRMNGGMRRR